MRLWSECEATCLNVRLRSECEAGSECLATGLSIGFYVDFFFS